MYAPKSDPRPAVKEAYIDQVPEDAMVVIGLPLELQTTNAPYVTVNNALYGGLMSTRAQYRQANGSVILGRIRDLDEHNDLKYPVWSYGVGTSAPGPLVKVVGINVPLEVKVASIDKPEDVLTINPGDYIVADKNGVVKLEDNEHYPVFWIIYQNELMQTLESVKTSKLANQQLNRRSSGEVRFRRDPDSIDL